ncbi:MAG: hypothetical protein [Circular genetic element sp.]|nr:MAG: hypothetical protein [Circular genetic element sp.]
MAVGEIYTPRPLPMGHMVALKKTSEMIQISFHVDESAANTFTQATVDVQLNPLDNEVMLIYAVDFDSFLPDAIAGVNTAVTTSCSTTSRTTIGRLDSSNVLGSNMTAIRAAGFVDGGVAFTTENPSAPVGAGLDYVGILATSDLHIQIEGQNNAIAKVVNGRIYCQRAKATSSVYAALVQSEALSS